MSNMPSFPAEVRQKLLDSPQRSLTDVTLATSDGERLHSVRFILMLRSEYFETMFSSGFKESQSNEVHVQLPASILRNVLEYMYTDDCHAMRQLPRKVQTTEEVTAYMDYFKSIRYFRNSNMSPSSCGDFLGNVYTVIKLLRAADYLVFPRLFDHSYRLLVQCVISYPFLFCTVWEALWGKDGCRSELPNRDHAMCILLKYQYKFVVFGRSRSDSGHTSKANGYDEEIESGFGINLLSFESLKLILQQLEDCDDLDRGIYQYYFIMLQIWVSLGDDPETRTKQARSLIKHFKFSSMESSFIVESVDTSNLLSDKEMRDIYRSAMKRGMERYGYMF